MLYIIGFFVATIVIEEGNLRNKTKLSLSFAFLSWITLLLFIIVGSLIALMNLKHPKQK